jgi:hypothetical protein
LRLRSTLMAVAAASVLAAGLGIGASRSLAQGSTVESVKVATRRITESQYRHAIRDIFGPDIVINARFEPERREDGLQAIGSTTLSITPSGFEQYFAMSRAIAEQVMDPKRREALVSCKPADPKLADAACTKAFVEKYGEALYRRPLTEAEVAARVRTAEVAAAQAGDFYAGLKMALVSLLMAPDHLFRIEAAEADPASPRQYRLDGYTKAARLSYLFWDAPPDAELLTAAKSGELHSQAGLQRQIARLSASPKMQDGARAFFTDMLELEAFDSLTKDPASYPKFNQSVADSAREQTLKTIVDHLVARKRDYRDLFTSNETFINRPLAAVYNLPYASAEAWAPYTFPAASERAGILTQVTFLALFSHPGASSPTKRGVKANEIFLCQPTPEPPADVDFSKVQALDKGTVRTRLLDHMQNPGCATCHRLSDPVGLSLEHFDGLGQLRTRENGALIDVSAEVGGATFTGAAGLGQYLHDNPRTPACLVRKVFAYGVGRPVSLATDRDYLDGQAKAFGAAGYSYPALLTSLASSPEFFKVGGPAQPPARVAGAETSNGADR